MEKTIIYCDVCGKENGTITKCQEMAFSMSWNTNCKKGFRIVSIDICSECLKKAKETILKSLNVEYSNKDVGGEDVYKPRRIVDGK